jgi:hypothetical protein
MPDNNRTANVNHAPRVPKNDWQDGAGRKNSTDPDFQVIGQLHGFYRSVFAEAVRNIKNNIKTSGTLELKFASAIENQKIEQDKTYQALLKVARENSMEVCLGRIDTMMPTRTSATGLWVTLPKT